MCEGQAAAAVGRRAQSRDTRYRQEPVVGGGHHCERIGPPALRSSGIRPDGGTRRRDLQRGSLPKPVTVASAPSLAPWKPGDQAITSSGASSSTGTFIGKMPAG
jgi:hypothetical protein